MSTFKKSGNVESRSTDRYYASTVSNVPQDVEDVEALTGAWQRRKAPPKTTAELDRERRIEWAHEQASKIRLASLLEQEIQYKQGRLAELKELILNQVQNADPSDVEYALDMTKTIYDVRKANEHFQRWIREKESESKDATTANTGSAGTRV
jgi:hypothetical protein